MFDKSGMRYAFERMMNNQYQVRLNGQFVCYSGTKDSNAIDEMLQGYGYTSRKEFYDEAVEESLKALRGVQ